MNSHFLLRKALHIVLSSILLGVLLWADDGIGIRFAYVKTALFVLLLILILIDLLRIDFHVKLPLYAETTKQKEKNTLHAVTFAVISVLLCLEFYSFQIAMAAIFMAQFSDVAGALVGTYLGKKPIFRNKTLAGSSAVLVTSFAVSYYFIHQPVIAGAMSVTATLVELAADRMEDNFVMPLIAGLVGTLLQAI